MNAGGVDVPCFVCADMGGGDTHRTTLVQRLGFIEAIVVSEGSYLY